LKIWFDILTPKQYLFFEYFIQKLQKQHKILCTSRKYEQVNGIRKFGSINPIIIGKHGGKNNVNKLLASLDRSKLLTKKIEKNGPDLLISFCSPEASRVAFGLGIPHIAFSDSPHANAVMRLALPYATKLLTPWIIPKKDFEGFGIDYKNIINYRTIDAAVIIKNYKKNKQKKSNLRKMILIRPEESEAAYITKKSKTVKIIKKIIEKFPDEQKIVLSRYKEQTIKLKKIFGASICLLSKPVSGKELLNNVDCFIGSGGTMTAESGLLGIPTVSFNAIPNRIEDFLVKKRIIVRSENPDRISREIYQSLNNPQIIKKRKENARKLVMSFEDPYQVLLKTIRTL
jgi:predicted glycosyltransferase